MKKIIAVLSLVTTLSTFSFYKMPKGTFFRKINDEYIEISNNDATQEFDGVYSYSPELGYLLWHEKEFIIPQIFNQYKFNQQWWDNLSTKDNQVQCKHINGAYLRKSDLGNFGPIDMITHLNQEKNLLEYRFISRFSSTFLFSSGFLGVRGMISSIETYPAIFDLQEKKPEDKISFYDVGISCDKSTPTLKIYKNQVVPLMDLAKLDDDSNNNNLPPIELQPALLNYMKAKKRQYEDQLAEHVPKLARDLKTPSLTENNEFKVDYISKIVKANKITYTQKQIDLLQNSKIVAVLGAFYTVLTNEEYINYWNQHHPKEQKQPEIKHTYSILTGFAYDTRDDITYTWIIDLDENISVLLDYADELKLTKK